MLERALELVDLCVAKAEGRIQPVAAVADTDMICLIPTTREPGRGFVDRVKALEDRDSVLSISLAHGFPWVTCPTWVPRCWSIPMATQPRSPGAGPQLAAELVGLREQLAAPTLDIDAALDQALTVEGGPVVLAKRGRQRRRPVRR